MGIFPETFTEACGWIWALYLLWFWAVLSSYQNKLRRTDYYFELILTKDPVLPIRVVNFKNLENQNRNHTMKFITEAFVIAENNYDDFEEDRNEHLSE